MNLTIYTDGGSLNNPGQAGIAFLIYHGNRLLHSYHKAIGIASNNVAEYTALIKALEYVKKSHPEFTRLAENSAKRVSGSHKILNQVQDDERIESIRVLSDSQLMVKQLNGEYKVKHHDIIPLHLRVSELAMQIGIPIVYTHVLREKNQEADALVKKALKR